jgi:quinol monooxygenase YgiN
MIVVTGRVQTAAALRAELLQVAQTMCAASRTDAGCIGYRCYEDTEQPDHFVFVEEWADEESLQAHFRQRHTTEFMGKMASLVSGPPDALFHTIASTRRLGPGGLVDA